MAAQQTFLRCQEVAATSHWGHDDVKMWRGNVNVWTTSNVAMARRRVVKWRYDATNLQPSCSVKK